MTEGQGYVLCPELSMLAGYDDGKVKFPLDMRCGAKCLVSKRAPLMEFRCLYGHLFCVAAKDIQAPRTKGKDKRHVITEA